MRKVIMMEGKLQEEVLAVFCVHKHIIGVLVIGTGIRKTSFARLFIISGMRNKSLRFALLSLQDTSRKVQTNRQRLERVPRRQITS